MVMYDVVYHRDAFVVEYNERGDIAWEDECRLGEAIQRAIKSASDNQQMLYEKQVGFRGSDVMVAIQVIVPVGPEQRDQLHAAVARFEELVVARLGTPINTVRRYVEPPTCINCGQDATYVRVKLREDGRPEEKKYFCDIHAQEQSEFDYSKANRYAKANHSSLSWEELDPTTA